MLLLLLLLLQDLPNAQQAREREQAAFADISTLESRCESVGVWRAGVGVWRAGVQVWEFGEKG